MDMTMLEFFARIAGWVFLYALVGVVVGAITQAIFDKTMWVRDDFVSVLLGVFWPASPALLFLVWVYKTTKAVTQSVIEWLKSDWGRSPASPVSR